MTAGVRKRRSLEISKCLARVIRRIGGRRAIRRIFVFAPTFGEPNLWPLYRKMWKKKIKVAFPKVRGAHLEFIVASSGRDFERGAFGIFEPARGRKAGRPGRGDVILVPCVGMDHRGTRLGHGGGYYDRWLGKNSKGIRIGVAFDCQRAGRLPNTSRDAKLHFAVTDRGIFSF